jgi:hypothetical protein
VDRPALSAGTERRDAVPRGGLVVLDSEVVVDRRLEVVEIADAGVELFRIAGLDEDVTVGKVESREHHHALAAARRPDEEGVAHHRHHVDVGVPEVRGEHLVGAAELLAN